MDFYIRSPFSLSSSGEIIKQVFRDRVLWSMSYYRAIGHFLLTNLEKKMIFLRIQRDSYMNIIFLEFFLNFSWISERLATSVTYQDSEKAPLRQAPIAQSIRSPDLENSFPWWPWTLFLFLFTQQLVSSLFLYLNKLFWEFYNIYFIPFPAWPRQPLLTLPWPCPIPSTLTTRRTFKLPT